MCQRIDAAEHKVLGEALAKKDHAFSTPGAPETKLRFSRRAQLSMLILLRRRATLMRNAGRCCRALITAGLSLVRSAQWRAWARQRLKGMSTFPTRAGVFQPRFHICMYSVSMFSQAQILGPPACAPWSCTTCRRLSLLGFTKSIGWSLCATAIACAILASKDVFINMVLRLHISSPPSRRCHSVLSHCTY